MLIKVALVGGKWCVVFNIGRQSFRLAPCETRKEAEWMAEQLNKAMSKFSQ
jgi:hypothetical protein